MNPKIEEGGGEGVHRVETTAHRVCIFLLFVFLHETKIHETKVKMREVNNTRFQCNTASIDDGQGGVMKIRIYEDT